MGCLCKSISKKNKKPSPIEIMSKRPPPIPEWPRGEGFASGSMDLGGLLVCQVSTFRKIWDTHQGGPDNLGATFYEPFSIPKGYVMLGCYSQPNKKPLFGWVLVGKDVTNNPIEGALKEPIGYTLVWSSKGNGYIWLPTPPDGYKPVGYVVTKSDVPPSLNKIWCVRYDLTESIEVDNNAWIWGPKKNRKYNKLNIYGTRPNHRGVKALGVGVGTFIVKKGRSTDDSLACLKNSLANLATMPNLDQVEALVEAYSPLVYFHPNEKYFPSSVDWFFQNGALLYKKGEETKPIPIKPTGLNLPQGDHLNDDGAFWLDLPVDKSRKEKVKKGNLKIAEAYLHIKPALGATFTDIAVWVFYPFNGPGKIKVGCSKCSSKKKGQHVGDWEHVTLRISNFNGELRSIYFSEHSGGRWVDALTLQYKNGTKPVIYASLHGHSFYPKAGVVMSSVFVANETAKSDNLMDTGGRYSVVAAYPDLLPDIVELPWLNYNRQWGPTTICGMAKVVKKLMPKKKFEKCVKRSALCSEQGPTGPKMKDNWEGDEKVK